MLLGLADTQEKRIENLAIINQKHDTKLCKAFSSVKTLWNCFTAVTIESILSIAQATHGKASNGHLLGNAIFTLIEGQSFSSDEVTSFLAFHIAQLAPLRIHSR